ncbi:MAG: serine hydrolase, partial [Bacteroidota bacterium]
AYSVHTHVEDYSKWVMALLAGKGLSASSYQELFQPQIAIPEDSPFRLQGVLNWTLGFAESQLPFGSLNGHGGNNPGYTSLLAFNREKKWGLVMFTNADQTDLPLQMLVYLNQET